MLSDDLLQRLKSNKTRTDSIFEDREKIASGYEKASEVASSASQQIDEIEHQFQKYTGLKTIDMPFLITAIALQCFRQYVLAQINSYEPLTDKEAAEPFHELQKKLFHSEKAGVKDVIKEARLESYPYHASRSQIINDFTVPYDLTKRSAVFGILDGVEGIGGKTHRHYTLGHDPFFGWVFGTSNILTNTLTLNKFRTCEVESPYITTHATPWRTVKMFHAVQKRYPDEMTDVGLALIKQALHMASDAKSTMSIGIPCSALLSLDDANRLNDYGINIVGLANNAAGLTASLIINYLIACIHGLFYDRSKDRKLYEVKTRKIILYSNTISSLSNVIGVAIASYLGDTEAIKKLDFGGLIVTLTRLLSDPLFIMKVKKEFLAKQWYDYVLSELT